MAINYKDLLKAFSTIEDDRKISKEIVIDALKDALAKAYKKDAELNDINVQVDIDEDSGHIHVYQCYNVAEEVDDDELEISLEDAQKEKADVQIGDVIRREVSIDGLSRASASLARNVMKQKIREAEKMSVYNEYIDQLDDMVLGIIESVKDKFTLINLGKTVALMPKSAEIPGERLVEGQKIRVVITEVNKDTKGSQVLVSRADPMLVKRLFEKEVPEIFQGIVEIRAIAREAGERTKMAVLSHNEDVDPIGACIGPRGSRVQEIIEELHGEKIDIFQWSDDLTQLVKNALAPAEVEAVLPGEDEKSLLVVVAEDQLSLAIGKKGKNARLAVKLTNHKIDIKTREELEEAGKDFDQMVMEAEAEKLRKAKEKEKAEIARMEEEAKKAEEARQKAAELLAQQKSETPEPQESESIPEEMQEEMQKKIADDIASRPDAAAAAAAAKPAVEKPAAAQVEVEKPRKKKPELKPKTEYVSVFEKLADTSKSKPVEFVKPKRKKKKDEDEFKVKNKDLLKEIGKKDIELDSDNKPVYTEEELAEIEAQQKAEEEKQFDIDYDDYADYYQDDKEQK